MKRLDLTQPLHTFALVGAIAVAACFTASAQTSTTTPVKKVPIPVHPAKAATPTAPVKAVAQKTQTPPPAVIPASSQSVLSPSSQAVVNSSTSSSGVAAPSNSVNGVPSTGSNPLTGLTSAGSGAVSNAISGFTSAGAAAASNAMGGLTGSSTAAPSNAMTGQTSTGSPNGGVYAGGSRAPVGGLGVGSFVGGGWTLIAYGCFRSGTRLFCDCDTSYQSNLQAASNIWYPVKLVDDGGKMTERHNAFFVGDDGSQFPNAYLTPAKPVRFMMEYDGIDQRYSAITLVLGQQQIQGVPITLIDPNLPAGTMPARASGTNGTSR